MGACVDQQGFYMARLPGIFHSSTQDARAEPQGIGLEERLRTLGRCKRLEEDLMKVEE